MKRLFLLILSVMLCLIIVVGYIAGTKRKASADNGPYGKYVLSTDSTQYIELKPDGSCLVGAKEYGPGGGTGKLELLRGTYEIKGDVVTVKLGTAQKPLISEFKLEGNTLVPPKMKIARPGLEGAKYIKK